LEELEAGGALELLEVPPGAPVGHAEARDGLLEGARLRDGLEEVGPSPAELDGSPDDHPHLDPRRQRRGPRAGTGGRRHGDRRQRESTRPAGMALKRGPSTTTRPLTITYGMPVGWRCGSANVAPSATREGSNTARSAARPARTSPRSRSPSFW